MSQDIAETAENFQEQLREKIDELKESREDLLLERDRLNQELDLIEIQIDTHEDTFEQITEFIQTVKR